MSDRILVGTRKGLFVIHRHGPGRCELRPPQFAGVPVEDGGARWVQVSAHLPPIRCLRFG